MGALQQERCVVRTRACVRAQRSRARGVYNVHAFYRAEELARVDRRRNLSN